MTTPTVPLRIELTFQMPGTPEQVWQAIATAQGNSAWFGPTDMEEREGGALVFHMGEMDSRGTVTGWEPARRLVYEEPDWAALAGHEGAAVTPLATEMLIEAQSGGTCVLRVVSTAFGTGADWENEFIDDVARQWAPIFEHLRLYLTHFPGQTATHMEAQLSVPGPADAVKSVMWKTLGVEGAGQKLDVNGMTGEVERFTPHQLLVRLTDPVPGMLAIYGYDVADGKAVASVGAYLFGADAPAYADRATQAWKAWLDGLAVPAA
jgi:uncharacterized protein YndB with AHSA1/START domain